MKILGLITSVFLVSFCFLGAQRAQAGPVTWADFTSTLPPIGTTTTVALGGGSQVDILFQATPTPSTYISGNLGSTGAAATGLAYTDLYNTTVFGGGGGGSTQYTVTLDNFVTGPNHIRGLFFVGDVSNNGGSVLFTATGGSVSSWTQVGSQFAIGGDTRTYTWTPGTGTLTSSGNAPDAGGIVLDTGSLSSYTQIQLSFNALTGDGWRYGVGEAIPEPSSFLLLGLVFGLGVSGFVVKRRSQTTASQTSS